MSQPTNILINHKEKKYFVWREENVKKIKKYSRIKNWHFYFENALGQSFPHTSGSVWCVENSDLTGSTNEYARYWYGNAEKYFFATMGLLGLFRKGSLACQISMPAPQGALNIVPQHFSCQLWCSIRWWEVMRNDEKWGMVRNAEEWLKERTNAAWDILYIHPIMTSQCWFSESHDYA